MLTKFEQKTTGSLGAAVGDLKGKPFRFHAEEIFPAASLIKVPVLIKFFQEKDAGRLSLQETVSLRKKDKVGGSGILLELHDGAEFTLLDIATLMIIISDNTATNILIDRLGMDRIQESIRQAGLQKTILGRKLMVEPEAPPANFTTPNDMFHLFKRLIQGELLASDSTRRVLDILFAQQYNEKIPLLLPKTVQVAHKTGEIFGVRHDCGIVRERDFCWIACFLTKNVTNERKADQAIAQLSLAFYKFFRRQKGAKNGV